MPGCALARDRLRGWAYRTLTSESVRELSDWDSVTTSPEVAAIPAAETLSGRAASYEFAAPANAARSSPWLDATPCRDGGNSVMATIASSTHKNGRRLAHPRRQNLPAADRRRICGVRVSIYRQERGIDAAWTSGCAEGPKGSAHEVARSGYLGQGNARDRASGTAQPTDTLRFLGLSRTHPSTISRS